MTDTRLQDLKRLLPQCLLKDQLRIGWRLAGWLRKNPGQLPPALDAWLAEAQDSVELFQRRRDMLPVIDYPKELPISAKRDEIVAAIKAHPVLVIAGETGSGKTTQIPKMCLEAGFGVRAQIGCTQPRRVAANALSRRLAEELNMQWGREIGCKVRFSDDTSPRTYVKFMTDGMLLAEAQGDPVLSEYEVIILDEAHERSLNIDFLLGRLKQLLAKRDDLKLIITSATIDTQSFSRAFDNAPIIEVSGRLYPVDVVYAPFDEASQEDGEITYVDAAVNAVETILIDSSHGDILVFMPAERDILETRDLLQTRGIGDIEVIPLFGRLSSAEQQRVFAPSAHRKIIVSTNIAESSLTVPGIRYVVDTGLARISRYNARTRAKRLPIEPVAQSSANQRKGRCGRVAEGICVRLYSEADFNERPPFAQPEIQRANLAEVILHLKAFHLGSVEEFPFIEPPTPAAIQGGYQLLKELGALDDARELTEIGHRLARLPVDPTIGRMILQARIEGALKEVLIIAAGLSIQDPRERPLEKQGAATAAHQRFTHPRSDFLTLLNIWNAFHDTLDSLKTQNQARRFCKTNFISYIRMREWREIHAQLEDFIHEMSDSNAPEAPGLDMATDTAFDAIHRSILTGLWSHVAVNKERNMYQLAGNRDVMLFPGSGLFHKQPEKRHGPGGKTGQPQPKAPSPPQWAVAGEIVETSRLFLRTVAQIDPLWIVELAPHLIKRAYLDPHWVSSKGNVLALERVTLNGLVVLERMVPYGKVNPVEATDIFIRKALVEEEMALYFHRAAVSEESSARGVHGRHIAASLNTGSAGDAIDAKPDLSKLPAIYSFLARNRQLREKIELWQTRLPNRVAPDLEQLIYDAYAKRLQNVSSIPELNRFLRAQSASDLKALCLTASELLGPHADAFNAGLFPDAVTLGATQVPLTYAYAPGEERDGVTVRLPFTLAQVIDPNALDWAVPGLREPQILHLLQSLPKPLRRMLMPLPPKAREMALAVAPSGDHFIEALSAFALEHYQVRVNPADWNPALLPSHLRPRFEVIGKDQKPVALGRDLSAIRDHLRKHETSDESEAWQKAVQKWEQYGLREWNFGDLPETIEVASVAGFPLLAYPALQLEDTDVSLRLFRKPEDAAASHRPAVSRLLENCLQREMAWAAKDLRGLARWRTIYVTLGPAEELETSALECVQKYCFSSANVSIKPENSGSLLPIRATAQFSARVEEIRSEIPGLVPKLIDWVGDVLSARQALMLCKKPYPELQTDLARLVPPRFLATTPLPRVRHLPRYLKAMQIRAERAAVNPAKDLEKSRRIQPLIASLDKFRGKQMSFTAVAKWTAARWLLEEYRVSIFAQELGTSEPVSTKAIEAMLAEIGS
jgi:ATP-dependent helicase HrpA